MEIDEVLIHFNEGQILILNFCLAYIMFGVSLELSWQDFNYVWKNKKSTFVGLFSQLILLPLVTLSLIWVVKPYPSLALGMLLIAVCPGGNVSNYAVALAKGNTALSVVLTAISTITSAFQTPFTFALLFILLPLEYQNTQTQMFIPFGKMVITIFTLMILPLVMGMMVKRHYPLAQQLILPWVKRSSMLIFFGIIVSGILSNIDNLYQYLDEVFFIVFIHNSIALGTGFLISKYFAMSQKDTISITIETGIQNSGLALVLIFNFFNGLGGMALIAAWWSIWHLLSALTLALILNKFTFNHSPTKSL